MIIIMTYTVVLKKNSSADSCGHPDEWSFGLRSFNSGQLISMESVNMGFVPQDSLW